MFQLKSEVQFDMAHFLHGYDGKCANIHGHRYRLVAMFQSETLCAEGQARGMVADFHTIKAALKGLPVSSVELYETPTNSCIYSE